VSLAARSPGGGPGPGLLGLLVGLAVAVLVGLPAVAQAEPAASKYFTSDCATDLPIDRGDVRDEYRAIQNAVNASCRTTNYALRNALKLYDGQTITLAPNQTVKVADGSTVKLDTASTVKLDPATAVAVTSSSTSPLNVREVAPSAGTATLDPASLAPVVTATEQGAGALHADLWFLLGLATVGIPAYFLVRLVMPRA
jgi:hypothetical protein